MKFQKQIAHKKPIQIEVTFLPDAAMKKLNLRYHKKNKPTDVISLSYLEGSKIPPDGFLGEIFIDIAYAERQARKIGQSLEEELRFLFVHGLLHIFGYDHKTPAEEVQMKRRTYEILGRKEREFSENNLWRP